ncbi:MAG: bifunctional 4-hydroxy-2-oxoglutarate aldolase/2-dehydro-3-deoxy-phosphogluconate aldolase [Gammaproteobacteria bacterium]|nr:bifunctional 4-hydroxy-2-oxoglutarate aldolase/2-dehydro-3-deoxy-phosphogluconate aldolase [Gammaproteobacteria bacterium]
MASITDIIPAGSILPVCTINNPDRAVPLARTLQDCGIHFIEITLRTESAFTAAENVINECPGMHVGIGTVTSVEQLQRAKEAGAQFCVSPGMTERLVNTAGKLDMPYLPGVSTVSEVMAAREMGLGYLKFFPAESAGGIGALRMFRELFPDVRFCPTGGLNENNAADYLRLDNVFCIGGSWLVPPEKIEAADWEGIKKIARRPALPIEPERVKGHFNSC